jgi:anaerobic dimethyl sulfoxide reductase subunit B (iron-sulfur subunit)
MARQYGFFVDVAACTGCKACQIACKDKNDLPVGVRWRRVVEVSGGGWQRRGPAWIHETVSYFVSVACNHCERPICAEGCPTGAIVRRPNGIVTIDGERCMGCHYCEWACPYGAPQFDEARGVMTKCDLCADEIERGRPPACVQACPMRVLEFGEIDELRARHGELARVEPLPDESLTEPAVALAPHPDCGRAETHVHVGNREEV